MKKLSKGIRDVEITDKDGKMVEFHDIKKIKVVFGPHYFVGIDSNKTKNLFFLGTTHHGFKAKANKLDDELEQIIDEVKEKHPEKKF